jgi:hypothetical protein
VVFEAQYSGLDEWNGIRRVLLEMPGVDDIRIGSVTTASAAVSVKYPGGGAAFAAALAEQGLRLDSGGSGFVVRSGR